MSIIDNHHSNHHKYTQFHKYLCQFVQQHPQYPHYRTHRARLAKKNYFLKSQKIYMMNKRNC